MKRIISAFLLLFTVGAVRAQALYPVPFEEKAAQASLIVEARVRKGQSFWNPAHSMIFTAWDLEVSKAFKGTVPVAPVQVLTQGGVVGNDAIVASDLLHLEVGDSGVFFLFPNTQGLKAPGATALLYDVYSSAQGFLKYASHGPEADAPFAHYGNVETDLYKMLPSIKNGRYQIIRSVPGRTGTTAQKTAAGTITGFTPARVHAGAHNDPTNNTLTINGSGFGTASGSAAIQFDNADDGTGNSANDVNLAYNNVLVTSWSPTQIVVKVPANAGTGSFKIYDNTGALAATSSTLMVDYAVMAVDFGQGPQEVNMMNTNGAGGYSISYSTSTAGSGVDITTSPALATFQRALATHRETGRVNFTDNTGGTTNTTTTQTINAGAAPNIAEYDNSNTGLAPLAAGVLAVCYSGFSKCTGGAVRRTGFDVLIRNAGYSTGTTTFTTGPCPPAETSTNDLDLETVLLHELGHAVNQGHVNDEYQYSGGGYGNVNPAAVMNYALLNGVKRSSYDNALLTGAQYAVTPKGQTYGSCTGAPFTEITPLTAVISARDECAGLFPASGAGNGASIAFDLVHATANKNTDPQYTALNTTNTGTNVTNTQYYTLKTTGSGSLTVTINGYTTTPTTQAACTNSGVELALYQVSACPTGQAYPTPVAQRTFTGNGALAPFTGLAAGTTYLFIADGIENTKATFNAVLTSTTVLPVTLLDFSGQTTGTGHLLTWRFDAGHLPRVCVLERSSDGRTFASVQETTGGVPVSGRFTDATPLPGPTYYRLRMTDPGGEDAYSNVVVLTARSDNQLALAPNPVRSGTLLYYEASQNGSITTTLYHSSGQLVTAWTFQVVAGLNIFPLDLSAYAAGSYLLRVNQGATEPTQYLRLLKQ